MRKRLLLYIALFLSIGLGAQEPKRVLFIGNSYTEVNNLPQMVQQIASSVGDRMEYEQNTPGGCTFQQHLQNQSASLIRQGGWDVVVLQEQSQLPSFPPEQVANECFPYAAQLVQEVYAANPDGEAMFYMTWGRRDGDQRNGRIYAPLATYEGMDSLLYERYLYMARENDASVCPVGRVWRSLRATHPDIELYASDGSHPSTAGTYAAATAFYTMIFRHSPENITYLPAGTDEAVGEIIRAVVRTVVFDSLEFWMRQPSDTAGQDTTHIDTTHTDTTQLDTTAISTVQTSLHVVRLYPNPTDGQVTVELPPAEVPCRAELFGNDGRKVRSYRITEPSCQLSLEDLPDGIYLLRLPQGYMRIIKQ